MKNKAVQYGLATGFLTLVAKLSIYYSGYQFTSAGGYINIVASLLILVLGIVLIQRETKLQNGGIMPFRMAIKAGLTTGIVAALILGLGMYLFFSFESENMIFQHIAFLKEANKAEAEIQKAVPMMKQIYAPFQQATIYISQTIIAGALLSFICSTFLIKNPQE